MAAKGILPQLGGTAAVWTTCLMYYQGVLLAGYLFAYLGASRLRVKSQIALTSALIILSWTQLPLNLKRDFATATTPLLPLSTPIPRLVWHLLRTTGLPLFVVASIAPLLQSWFSRTRHRGAADPYYLYGASNAGSLAALLLYPSLVEPQFSLSQQSQLWSWGYLALGSLVFLCAWLARNAVPVSANEQEVQGTAPSPYTTSPLAKSRWWRWVGLAFLPSSLLLGVTTYITSELAPVPLLWIIPLALYLITWIAAFSFSRWLPLDRLIKLLPLELVVVAFVMGFGFLGIELLVPHLLTFFTAGVVCHGLLARDRPAPDHLTGFYLAIALGGALGGLFNGLVAPSLFNRLAEYPISLILTCLVPPAAALELQPTNLKTLKRVLGFPLLVFALTALAIKRGDGAIGGVATMLGSGLVFLACWNRQAQPVRFGLTLGAAWLASGLSAGLNGRVISRERNFFGVLQVTEDLASRSHRLFHGQTLHGQQSLIPSQRREPSSYFHRAGPIGQVFEAIQAREASEGAEIAIAGLGIGTLATYAKPGERWTFYEIDPAVVRIASNPSFFTYLADCQAKDVNLVVGDARVELSKARDHRFRLIVLDAFNSDAVPVHLLTREALRLYRAKLTEQGILVFHISNRSIDLEPVVTALARDAGLVCRIRADRQLSPEQRRSGLQPTIWAVMSASEQNLGRIGTDPRWTIPTAKVGSVWSDQFSSLLPHLILLGRRPGHL